MPVMRRIDSHTRLRLLLGALLLGLAIPAWVLFRQASSQLDLEAFRRQQLLAEDTTRRIDAALTATIATESARPFDDYLFASVPANARSNIVQRSPLSSWPVARTLPGVIGYFQVDAAGRLATPLLPTDNIDVAEFGLASDEIAERQTREARITAVLAENRLVRTALAAALETVPESAPSARRDRAQQESISEATSPPLEAMEERLESELGQTAFDELTARNLQRSLSENAVSAPAALADQAPQLAEPQMSADVADDAEMDQAGIDSIAGSGSASGARVATFESELEPLQFSRLDTGHVVLYRNAWRDDVRYIQGILLDSQEFLGGATQSAFSTGGHAAGTRLFAAVDSVAMPELTPQATQGSSTTQPDDLLYSARLSPPLAQIELSFAAGELPHGPAARLLFWTAVVLASVLVGGLYAFYRFGTRQIALTRQQEDFVSAVSHELKTPLTSIRMYGEMLKSGWASDEKKQDYYDYIYTEGERLSRLIDNVLQIARFNRGTVPVKLVACSVGELIDLIRSKISTSIERAGFDLQIECATNVEAAQLLVDQDAIVQIFINLVDNAIKFTRDEDRHAISISASSTEPDTVLLCVRDFGPGISQAELKRLFELFYRPDNEKTRATSGTGIGLALVRQLATAMGGTVDVRNCQPGAEFRLVFPRSQAA